MFIQEIHIGNSEWWEKVNTAAVGVVLGVSIGASCFALPAFADFLVSSIYIFFFQKNHSCGHASLYGRNRNREVNLLMVCCFQSFDHADLRGRDMSSQDLKGVVFAGT